MSNHNRICAFCQARATSALCDECGLDAAGAKQARAEIDIEISERTLEHVLAFRRSQISAAPSSFGGIKGDGI